MYPKRNDQQEKRFKELMMKGNLTNNEELELLDLYDVEHVLTTKERHVLLEFSINPPQ